MPDNMFVEGYGIEFDASGVSTYYAGGRYWYVDADLFTFLKGFESQILTHHMADLEKARSDLLGTTSPLFILSSGSETMRDIVTSDYQKLKSMGNIVSSPMTYTKDLCQTTPIQAGSGFSVPVVVWSDLGKFHMGGSIYCQRIRMDISFGCQISAFGVTDSVFNAFVDQLDLDYLDGTNAINQSHSRIYEAEADLALFALEATKTGAHLASVAFRIAKLVKDIKKGNLAKLAPRTFARYKDNWPKALASDSGLFADAWLEARYAWRPLILDAQAAWRYLEKTASQSRRTFRGFETEQDNEDDYTFSISAGDYHYDFSGVLTLDKSVRAGVLTEIDPDFMKSRDLGSLNPAGLIWEVTPWSFVVDWFVDVSGFLAASNPTHWFSILTSWASYSSEVTFVGYVDITNLTSMETQTVDFRLSSLRKKRDIDTSPIYINFDVNFDVYKLIDSVSLLRRFKH
jgi:hypothetical protein